MESWNSVLQVFIWGNVSTVGTLSWSFHQMGIHFSLNWKRYTKWEFSWSLNNGIWESFQKIKCSLQVFHFKKLWEAVFVQPQFCLCFFWISETHYLHIYHGNYTLNSYCSYLCMCIFSLLACKIPARMHVGSALQSQRAPSTVFQVSSMLIELMTFFCFKYFLMI